MDRRLSLIFIIIVSMLFTACVNQSNNKTGRIEKKEKAPRSLSQVADGIDEILDSIDSISEIMELSESEFQTQRNKSQKKDNPSNEENKGQGEQEQEENKGENKGVGQDKKEEKKDIMTKEEELVIKWKEIDDKLKKVHEAWNEYEVESLEKGINSDKAKEFKKNLNAFTIAVEDRKISNIMDTGSKSIGSLAPFFDLYKDEIKGDLSRVKYSVHQSFLKGYEGNKQAAQKLLNGTEEYTARIRQKLGDDQNKIKGLDRLTLAISDMKLALEENNGELLRIKRDIALNNIKSLQE